MSTTGDPTDYLMACYLIDGLNISNESVTDTTLKPIPEDEGGGYRARIEVDGVWVESMSRLGWFEAAEGCVRSVLWVLNER